MKKLLLSLLIASISPFCAATQQIDRAALQSMRTILIDQLQKVEENFKNTAEQYGDLCIVPSKIANEFCSHDVVKKMEKAVIKYFVSQIVESGMIRFETEGLPEKLFETELDKKEIEEGCKIFEDIKQKYEAEGNQIYQAILQKIRNNDSGVTLTQNIMIHSSQCDLVSLYITLYSGKEIALGVLREVEAILNLT